MHFWSYTSEDFDVDSVMLTFFDAANTLVGSLRLIRPQARPGILAQDIGLAAPLNVRYVTAFLTGSNAEAGFPETSGSRLKCQIRIPSPSQGLSPW